MNVDSSELNLSTPAAAAEMIAACLTVLAEMKNLKFSVADCHMIAGRVAARFSLEELSAFLADKIRNPCPLIEEANAELDRMAALHVVLIFEKVGRVAPLSSEVVEDLVNEILSTLPPRKPGEPVYRWPEPALWEQMAASRFRVSTPGEQAQFGAGIVPDAGRC